jgi:hypothetical protein
MHDYPRLVPDAPLLRAKKAKPIALGYPWPENLEGRSLSWLEAEIRDMTPKPDPEAIEFRAPA